MSSFNTCSRCDVDHEALDSNFLKLGAASSLCHVLVPYNSEQ